MTRRGYPPEFRRRVAELVEGGRKVAEVDRFETEVGGEAIRVRSGAAGAALLEPPRRGPRAGEIRGTRQEPSIAHLPGASLPIAVRDTTAARRH